MTMARYDVGIVGLGPVGALAANLLASAGLSVFAVEPARVPYDKPRAKGLDHESLRLLQRIDLAEPLQPFLGRYRTSEYRAADGQVLRRILPQPPPHPLSWPPYVTVLQPELERLLRGSFERWPTLDVALGHRTVGIENEPDGVRLVVEDGDTQATRAVFCKSVLACDGAASPTRSALGMTLEDLGFDEPWLVVDLLVGPEVALPDATIQYCDPARPCTFIHGPGDVRRWEMMILPGEDPAEMIEEATIWSLLRPWVRPDQARLWRAATYRFHALVADRWRCDRVFLVGDAAHQTPPFMAQGLNQGFRDVANLCWKLEAVLTGRAASSLLETYEEERRPNARAVIALTKQLGRIICERDPVAAASRNRVMLQEMREGTGEMVRQAMLPVVTDGFLLRTETGALTPGAGLLFPQPWIDDDGVDRRLDDVVRAHFLMVVTPGYLPAAADLALAKTLRVSLVRLERFPVGRTHPTDKKSLSFQRAGAFSRSRKSTTFVDNALGQGVASDGLRCVAEDGLIAAWLDRHAPDAAVLVRPDHLVFGSCRGAGAERCLLDSLATGLRHETD